MCAERGPVAWAAALALLGGCSPEDGTEPRPAPPDEVIQDSEELPIGTEELRRLSLEEIWAVGVEQFGSSPEEPPADRTRDSMIHEFYVEVNYGSYYDGLDYSE